MKQRRVLRVLGIVMLLLGCFQAAWGQTSTPAKTSIPSLSEQGESLSIKDVSPQTGFVTFASSSGQGILLSLPSTASAEQRAMSFVDTYGGAFGLASSSQVRLLKTAETD